MLHKPGESKDYEEGANRARITSAVITGIYMLGDNFSEKGSLKGDKEARERAKLATSNKGINDIARMGKSFYPVYGYKAIAPDKSENFFMYRTDKCLYLAVFNFDDTTAMNDSIRNEDLGIVDTDIDEIRELWTNSKLESSEKGLIQYSVPPQDVRVYELALKKPS